VSRPARAALALLAGLLAGPAAAYVRTNTCPDDGNAGYLLWLPGSALGYRLSGVHVPVGCAGGDFATFEALVNASVATWASAGAPSVCTGLAVAYGGVQPDAQAGIRVGAVDGQNLIVARTGSCDPARDPASPVPRGAACLTQGGCGNLYNCWEDVSAAGIQTLALTWVSFDTGSGRITDADMELQDWNGSTATPTGHYLTCAASGALCDSLPGGPWGLQGCVEWDLGSVVTHEAGHMIGLDHVTGIDAVMNPSLSPGNTTKRVLRPDDVAGACAVYPAGGQPSQVKLSGWCVKPASKGCGCGSGGPASLAWLLAPLLLRRRRAATSPSPVRCGMGEGRWPGGRRC